MYKLLKQEGSARRAEFTTNRGTVQTPAFMNVATAAAIKGAVSAGDLKTLGCQIMLSNTYHLHVRPGDEVIRGCGGLHRFTTWDGPILTDSGGFQVFACNSPPYNRRGGYLCFTCGWQTDIYGTRGKHDNTVKLGFYNRNGV